MNTGKMNNQGEELMALIVRLSEEYTHKESSSVTYETATMLMEAVLYCLEEYYVDGRSVEPAGTELANQSIHLEDAYRRGYDLVVYKVKKARALYNRLVSDFDDYGCRCYGDTILKGMPQFFRRYDARFKPQDHILALDYPVMQSLENRKGIDRVWEYLCCIRMEKEILKYFSREQVLQTLDKIDPEYQELYLGNICQAVLEAMEQSTEGSGKTSREESVQHWKEILERRCPEREEFLEYLNCCR